MTITLELTGHLPHYGGQAEVRLELAAGEPLDGALKKLGIPPDEVLLFIIDGKHFYGDHVPRDGDRVNVLPAISGG
ncbi:MAG: MoaD/ThiS family protein [Candidatus Eremiobacteraeota bacterium]|nr:MoaD/ThiS family protein [Candidatus Eremiobacteraeota bacterium]